MSSDSKDYSFRKDVSSLWSGSAFNLPDNYREEVLNHPFLKLYSGMGKSCFLIGDHSKSELIYVSDTFESMFGYKPEEVMEIGEEFIFQITNPDDIPLAIKFAQETWKLTSSTPAEERKNLTYNLYYKAKHKKGHFIKVLHQIFLLKSDKVGNLLISMIMYTDISHWNMSNDFMATVVNNKTNEIQLFNKQTHVLSEKPDFTSREIQILKRLVQGKNSKDIGEDLHISYHTVRNHRKNMMEKAEVHSTAELINLANTFGII